MDYFFEILQVHVKKLAVQIQDENQKLKYNFHQLLHLLNLIILNQLLKTQFFHFAKNKQNLILLQNQKQ
jgi:hypothetical protein